MREAAHGRERGALPVVGAPGGRSPETEELKPVRPDAVERVGEGDPAE